MESSFRLRLATFVAALLLGGSPANAGRLDLFATLPDGAAVAALRADPAGYLYLAGFLQPADPRSEEDSADVFVAKLSPDGSQLLYWTTFGGTDSDSAQALALDSAGSAYVTGTTMSRNFPATSGALQTDFQSESHQAFVAKLDPQGQIEYQSFIGGSSNTTGRDIFANTAGEVLITGQSVGDGFPATPGAAVTSTDVNTMYVVKIDGTGSNLLVGLRGVGGNKVVADAAGNIYIGGSAYGLDPIPVTPGAFQATHTLQACAGTGFLGIACFYGYVVKLNPVAGQVLFATFVTGSFGSDIAAMHVDGEGNVLIAGTTNSPDYPVTPGALLDHYIASAEPPPVRIGRPPIIPPPSTGYVTKLNNTGSELLFSTYFSGTERDSITGMAVGPESIHITGNASSRDLPGLETPQCIPAPYVSQITADGSAVVATQLVDRSPSDLRLALLPDSGPYLAGLGLGTAILRADFSARPDALACVLDAANYLHAETVTPGRLLTLFGNDLAASVEVGRPAESGLLPTSLGGLTVSFGGIPAPLLYVSPQQVNLQVPYEVAADPAVPMEVTSPTIDNGDGSAVEPRPFAVVPRVPTAFIDPTAELSCDFVVPQVAGGAQYPVARNGDVSLNSCANPAASRSVVTIFLHGVGATQSPQVTGAVTGERGEPLDLSVSFDSPEIEFVSAQNHPGAIGSVWEVQFRLPQTNLGYVAVKPMVDGVLVAPGGLVIWVER